MVEARKGPPTFPWCQKVGGPLPLPADIGKECKECVRCLPDGRLWPALWNPPVDQGERIAELLDALVVGRIAGD